MLPAKYQPNWPGDSGEVIWMFVCFLHVWVLWPSLISDHEFFFLLNFVLP